LGTSEVGTIPNRVGHYRPIDHFSGRFEFEHICWDPKDGDLCLARTKSVETLMEVRSDTDVQIVRRIWV
jgi:hypothetical protein